MLHFGYEFKYGSNDVDSKEQIKGFPEYIEFLMPKFEEILQTFNLDERGFATKSEGENYFYKYRNFD